MCAAIGGYYHNDDEIMMSIPMMFPEFAQRCRDAFGKTARELDALAVSERVSARDNAAGQISQHLELAAALAVDKRVNRATFLEGCNEYYDNASEAS